MGTGKPATIPPDLLDQCPAILNHPQATIDDGIVLAEILLFSALCNKHKPLLLDRHGHCPELTAWEKRWEHLLSESHPLVKTDSIRSCHFDSESEKAMYLRFGHEFAYLVLAMVSVDEWRSSERHRSAKGDASLLPDAFQACAHKHALSMAHVFLKMPAALIQELPKFHHICIAYCCLILSEYTHKSEALHEDVFNLLRDVCEHYRRFSDELPAVMNVALEKTRQGLGEDRTPKQKEQFLVSDRLTGHSRGGQTGVANNRPGTTSVDMRRVDSNPARHDIEDEQFGYELDFSSFPTVEDFFGSWMMDIVSE